MYKKIALIAALLYPTVPCASHVTPWLELKPSYFCFTSSPMSKIYHTGGFQLQGSASVPISAYVDVYGSIGYRQAWGHALSTCQKTNIIVVPVDIGIKPVWNVCEHGYYFFAIGPRFFYVHQHNSSSYVDCNLKGGGVGFFVNTGVNVVLAEHCILGIFGEYSYEQTAIYPKKPLVYSNGQVQIGGFAVGVSLGYAF